MLENACLLASAKFEFVYAGAARLYGLPGCSLPWKMQGKRFRQTRL